MNAGDLVNNQLWWHGPAFLKDELSSWPDLPTTFDTEDANKELVKNSSIIVHSLASQTRCDTGEVVNLEKCMNVENFRSRIKLLHVTSIILKFIALLKKDPNVQKSVITAEDISSADHKWTQTIQSNSFSTEWQRLHNGEDKVIMKHLVLFMDRDKIIRCEGRINQSTLPVSSKNPILLPAKHLFTTLLIQNRHQLVHHNGIRETLAAVRETHWILRGREAVKRVLRICVVCRKFEGKPYPAPLPPDLPEERVSEGPPFANTGINFAGPLYVKSLSTDSQQTDRVKTYICLFTCASTRAIHLELTETLSAQSFLQAFRRFVSRRGLPSTIMSDNAKTFKSASAEV